MFFVGAGAPLRWRYCQYREESGATNAALLFGQLRSFRPIFRVVSGDRLVLSSSGSNLPVEQAPLVCGSLTRFVLMEFHQLVAVGNGRGRSRIASIAENTALFAPMPRASVKITAIETRVTYG